MSSIEVSKLDGSHRPLIFCFQFTVECHVLINCQRLTSSVACDQLKFSVCHSRVPSQPSDGLVAEGVRSGFYFGFLGIHLDDLLHSASAVLARSLGLEEPSIFRMRSNVSAKCSGEGLAEQNISILAPLSLTHEDFADLKIHIIDLDIAEFTHPHSREKEKAQHQRVLNVIGSIHDLVKVEKLIGSHYTWKFLLSLFRCQIAHLSYSLRDVPPLLVIQTRLANDSSQLRDDSVLP